MKGLIRYEYTVWIECYYKIEYMNGRFSNKLEDTSDLDTTKPSVVLD